MMFLRWKMAEKGGTSHSDACKQAAHYWILNDKSFGICKKCGAQKQFPMIGVFGWQQLRWLGHKKAPSKVLL
jgi:hypothetical protein